MILTGTEIMRCVASGDIEIDPFDRDLLTPNSYDLTFSGKLITYDAAVIDPLRETPTIDIPVPSDGVVLEAGRVYLASSHERIGSNMYVPMLKGRSSAARLGLFTHITADIIDLGFFGCITMQLYAVQPFVLRRGVSIAQLTFWTCEGDRTLYDGKYQGAAGPIASRSWLDGKGPGQ